MRDGWKSRWGWRVSAVVLVGGVLALGTGTVVTQASEFEEANNKHQQNPFQRILHKLDKILDAIKAGGGSEGNHTLRWDQVLPAAQRFVVLAAFNNEAVLDKETGLVWEQTPAATTHTWSTARFQCTGRVTGGRMGWRLPSISELSSLVDPNQSLPPALPVGHPFPNVQSAVYWSATTDAELPTDAWNVGFGGSVGTSGKTYSGYQVWCVRGGMNADQY
jgi:hypothetical protein